MKKKMKKEETLLKMKNVLTVAIIMFMVLNYIIPVINYAENTTSNENNTRNTRYYRRNRKRI